MLEKIVYAYNKDSGVYTGETIARRDPLGKEERYLLPAFTTQIPPTFQPGYETKWGGTAWILTKIIAPETTAPSLEELKAKKIAEIKGIRDAKNIETIVDTQAATLDEDGSPTGQTSYFIFRTGRHPTNPAADSSGILTSAILLNRTISYSTKSPLGEKIIVAITPEIAKSLLAHITLRNNNNYKLSDAIEAAVKAATTKEEVEAITWDLKYLD